MANNTPEIDATLDEVRRQLEAFNTAVTSDTRETTIQERSKRAAAAALKKQQEQQEKFGQQISKTATGLTSFARTVSGSGGSFAPLNTVIGLAAKAVGSVVGMMPVFGKALSELAHAGGEAAKFMVNAFDKAYSTFERMSDSGVVSTFTDLKRSSDVMGIGFANAEKVLTSSSKELATFAGSTTAGRMKFDQIAQASTKVRESFQKLGIGQTEFNEYQIRYMAQQQRMGKLTGQSDQQIIAGSEEYIKELDQMAKLTGLSRKDIQAKQEARLSDARFRSSVATWSGNAQKEANKLLNMTSKLPGNLGQGLQDMIASGGVPTTEAANDLAIAFQGAGIDWQQVSKGLENGTLKASDFIQQLSAVAGKQNDKIRENTRFIGDSTRATRMFVALEELRAFFGKTDIEIEKQIAATQKETIDATTGMNTALAETRISLEKSSKNIEQLATESTLVTGAMKLMAKGLEQVTETLYEKAGLKLPRHLQLRKDRRLKLEEAEALKKDIEKRGAAGNRQPVIGPNDAVFSVYSNVGVGESQALRDRLIAAEADVAKLDAEILKEDAKSGIYNAGGSAGGSSGGGGGGTSGGGGGGTSGGTSGAPGSAEPRSTSAAPISGNVQGNLSMMTDALRKQGITDPKMVNAILANVMKETGGKINVEEDISGYANTSNKRIREIFGSRVAGMSDEEINRIKKDPAKFADMLYGKNSGMNLGNTEAGEGYKYRGRGAIGITGKSNYAAASQDLFGDDRLVKNPELLTNPEIAAQTSAWFMKKHTSAMAKRLGLNENQLTQEQANLLATSTIAGTPIRPGVGFHGTEQLNKVNAYSTSLSSGGIMRAPSTGQSAVLSGTNAVVPMNSSTTSKTISAVTGKSTTSSIAVTDALQNVTSKLDGLTNVLSQNVDNQSTIMRKNM